MLKFPGAFATSISIFMRKRSEFNPNAVIYETSAADETEQYGVQKRLPSGEGSRIAVN